MKSNWFSKTNQSNPTNSLLNTSQSNKKLIFQTHWMYNLTLILLRPSNKMTENLKAVKVTKDMICRKEIISMRTNMILKRKSLKSYSSLISQNFLSTSIRITSTSNCFTKKRTILKNSFLKKGNPLISVKQNQVFKSTKSIPLNFKSGISSHALTLFTRISWRTRTQATKNTWHFLRSIKCLRPLNQILQKTWREWNVLICCNQDNSCI